MLVNEDVLRLEISAREAPLTQAPPLTPSHPHPSPVDNVQVVEVFKAQHDLGGIEPGVQLTVEEGGGGVSTCSVVGGGGGGGGCT